VTAPVPRHDMPPGNRPPGAIGTHCRWTIGTHRSGPMHIARISEAGSGLGAREGFSPCGPDPKRSMDGRGPEGPAGGMCVPPGARRRLERASANGSHSGGRSPGARSSAARRRPAWPASAAASQGACGPTGPHFRWPACPVRQPDDHRPVVSSSPRAEDGRRPLSRAYRRWGQCRMKTGRSHRSSAPGSFIRAMVIEVLRRRLARALTPGVGAIGAGVTKRFARAQRPGPQAMMSGRR
jgi:hypothetical protein